MNINVENNVIHCSPDPTIKIEPKGLGVLLFDNIKRYQNNIAQIDAVTGEEQTYQQLLTKSIRIARYIETLHLSKEDIVAIYVSNSLDTTVPFLASLFLHIAPSPMDITCNYEESLVYLKLLTPRLIFCDENKVEDVERALRELSIKCHLVVFGNSKKHKTYTEIVDTPTGDDEIFEPTAVEDLFSTAFILFTSGTTSYPKAVCCTHYGFMECNLIFKQGHCFHRSLQYSSLYWISGAITLIAIVVDGGTKVLCTKFDVAHTLETIQKYKVTYAWMVPLTCQKLVDSNLMSKYDLSSVSSMTIAGTTMSDDLYTEISKGFPNATFCNGYGNTENGGVIFNFNPSRDKIFTRTKTNSVGLPMSGNSYKVIDLETRDNLGPGKIGEIRVKNLVRMKGYYRKPEATANMFDEDGFMCTGDLGYYDEDFCFWIKRRINDVLIYRQWRMVPSELEVILSSHPAVQEAAIIGILNVEDREHPMGVVVLKPGSNPTEQELLDFYNGKVKDYQKIRAGIKFVKSLPYTTSGKLKRMELRRQFANNENA